MRKIIKEDYGIGVVNASENKHHYYIAKRLSNEQINKFVQAKTLIGYEVDVLYRKKQRKCIIVAVSLPDKEQTVYTFKDGSKQTYSNFPFSIFLCIEDGRLQGRWFNNIDSFNFDNAIYKGVHFETHGTEYTVINKNFDCVELIYDYNSGHLELPCA
jgi:hypothetical protein